jgi:hypothetical protein
MPDTTSTRREIGDYVIVNMEDDQELPIEATLAYNEKLSFLPRYEGVPQEE